MIEAYGWTAAYLLVMAFWFAVWREQTKQEDFAFVAALLWPITAVIWAGHMLGSKFK